MAAPDEREQRAPVAKWLETVASRKGPKHPQVRAVLLALGTFMNGQGSTYVSLEALHVCVALHSRRVRFLIRTAEKTGWLVSSIERQGAGRAWRLKTYRAALPAGTTPAGREDRMSPRQRAKREDTRSSRQPDVRISESRREDQACNDVRLPEPSKSYSEISNRNLASRSAQKARAPLEPGPGLPEALAKRLTRRFNGGGP
ncbi:MAG: hypothetical protein WD793_10860 [Steroidobacteraceae bacterium]